MHMFEQAVTRMHLKGLICRKTSLRIYQRLLEHLLMKKGDRTEMASIETGSESH